MLDAIMVMLVVIAFMLAGGYARLRNNLLTASDDAADGASQADKIRSSHKKDIARPLSGDDVNA
jgi:hypothetical protein